MEGLAAHIEQATATVNAQDDIHRLQLHKGLMIQPLQELPRPERLAAAAAISTAAACSWLLTEPILC
jgi:hypothetical protein